MRPFFMTLPGRTLFCAYHPSRTASARGAVLYVPAFAEEMHKSRRMASVLARRLANRGVAVLIVDLTGSGDSSGDFGDARWDLWLEDIRAGLQWLQARTEGPSLLWSLRLGALLAADAAREFRDSVRALVMWQPVIDGKEYLTQLLRLTVARDMAAGRPTGVQTLRQVLARGTAVEIGGYALNPSLAAALDSKSLPALGVRGLRAGWLEVVSDPDRLMPPAAANAIAALTAAGMDVYGEAVVGEQFWHWNTSDITECPELLDRTTTFVDRVIVPP